jgi:hypothetical protein
MPKDDSRLELNASQLEWFRSTIVGMMVANKLVCKELGLVNNDYARGIQDGFEMALNTLEMAINE